MTFLVTGGAGFIGSALVQNLLNTTKDTVVVLDNMSYASSSRSINYHNRSDKFRFINGNINDATTVHQILSHYKPAAIFNLAAETHVDRSIEIPSSFVDTNVVGTSILLEECLKYWRTLSEERAKQFRFHHISTDEVYGSAPEPLSFTENTAYDPRSPYSATKAAADHLVRAWHHTYGLPTLITNCSNNYGPRQFPEKLIPLVINRALLGTPLPIYGDGLHVRDWLFVDDHVSAIRTVLDRATPGSTYNIGGEQPLANISVVQSICRTLDQLAPQENGQPHEDLITYVQDRLGHDRRYSVDSTKIRSEFGWKPATRFHDGLRITVQWYLKNLDWWTHD